MLLIKKNTENTLVVTLTELTTIDNPTYLWTVKCEQNQHVYNFILTDISEFKNRYNEFILEEGVDVEFNQTGYYYYTIRQQSSTTNLDPEFSGDIVEVGRIRIKDDE